VIAHEASVLSRVMGKTYRNASVEHHRPKVTGEGNNLSQKIRRRCCPLLSPAELGQGERDAIETGGKALRLPSFASFHRTIASLVWVAAGGKFNFGKKSIARRGKRTNRMHKTGLTKKNKKRKPF